MSIHISLFNYSASDNEIKCSRKKKRGQSLLPDTEWLLPGYTTNGKKKSNFKRIAIVYNLSCKGEKRDIQKYACIHTFLQRKFNEYKAETTKIDYIQEVVRNVFPICNIWGREWHFSL